MLYVKPTANFWFQVIYINRLVLSLIPVYKNFRIKQSNTERVFSDVYRSAGLSHLGVYVEWSFGVYHRPGCISLILNVQDQEAEQLPIYR